MRHGTVKNLFINALRPHFRRGRLTVAGLAAALVAAILPVTVPASAAEQVPVPLFAVEGPLQQVFVDGLYPPIDIDITSLGLFVLPGGDVVESDFFGAAGFGVQKGPATAALYQGLLGQLAASRVGIQRDCSALATPGGAISTSFDWKITWAGRNGRFNVFRVVTADRDQSLPPCPNEVLTLIGEIFYFRDEWSVLPTTELIFSGPR
jgi:hypothetical protein